MSSHFVGKKDLTTKASKSYVLELPVYPVEEPCSIVDHFTGHQISDFDLSLIVKGVI